MGYKKRVWITILMLTGVLLGGCASTVGGVILSPVTLASKVYGTMTDERSLSQMMEDNQIKYAVMAKLTAQDSSTLLNVGVECLDGHLFLIGEYTSEEKREESIQIAEETQGVKKVTTHLIPVDEKSRCDLAKNLEITATVRQWLITDSSIWSSNINVHTLQCDVVLVGLVKEEKEIQKSIQIASEVVDVDEVVSYLSTYQQSLTSQSISLK